MYLLTRVRTADPAQLPEAIAWAVENRDYVNAQTDIGAAVSLNLFGRPHGTVTWGAVVQSRAHVASMLEKLTSDPGYIELQRRGAALFLDSGEQMLRQVIHASGTDPATVRPAFTQMWTAQMSRYQVDAALDWGIRVTDHVAGISGTGLVFLVDNYGVFGSMAWIATLDSAEQADTLNNAMLGDAHWKEMIKEAADYHIDFHTKAYLSRVLP